MLVVEVMCGGRVVCGRAAGPSNRHVCAHHGQWGLVWLRQGMGPTVPRTQRAPHATLALLTHVVAAAWLRVCRNPESPGTSYCMSCDRW